MISWNIELRLILLKVAAKVLIWNYSQGEKGIIGLYGVISLIIIFQTVQPTIAIQEMGKELNYIYLKNLRSISKEKRLEANS